VETGSGATFNAFGLQFFLRASAADTCCGAEIAEIVAPAGFTGNMTGLVDLASNLAFTGIAGELTVTVNGVPYALTAGGFLLVKKGTPFVLSSTLGATFQVVAIGPGTLGFFHDVSIYQEAVGGPQNLDPCVVDEIGRRFCIFPAPGASACFGGIATSQVPGTVRFIPGQVGGCCNGTWGLSCCQYLVVSASTTVPLAPGIGPSVTIKPEDCAASIVLDPTVTSTAVTATIIKDPGCGSPDVIANPTVNGLPSAILNTGVTYNVFFDAQNNNVIIRPVFPGPVIGNTVF